MDGHGGGGGGGGGGRIAPGRKNPENGSLDGGRKPPSSRSSTPGGERTVKRLRLSRALTIPENTTVREACRRMASRKADAVLLTDSNALLCGILTDKDVTMRVVARELKPEETPVSKVMTRNPTFVLSDTLAVEALQKMVQGRFRHLPVVENGEVIALLDIAECLYDAIARMERAAEKGKAIAAAVEGVEKHWGASLGGPNSFIEAVREKLFSPSLSTIISENPKLVILSPTDSVLDAAKRMLELKSSAAVVAIENKPRGILTSKDILMRLVAQNLSPASTTVEKVMTSNPECAAVTTPIVDALHTMHDGKFLHLPVVDKDGNIASVLDVIHVTHAAVATVGKSGVGSEQTSSMIQKFWDSAMALGPLEEDDDSHSIESAKLASDVSDTERAASYPASGMSTAFGFKLEDKNGRMHRFNCDAQSLTDLISSILRRVGDDIDKDSLPLILYEDSDNDLVMLASDSDLMTAVEHAKLAGWKSLRLHLDYSVAGSHGKAVKRRGGVASAGMETATVQRDLWAAAYGSVAAGAALVAGLGVMAYLRRSSS